MYNSNQNYTQAESAIEQETPLLDTAAKEKFEKRFQRGLLWIGVSALVLVLSFGLNVILFHSNVDFTIFMYVCTSVGAIGLLKGMGDLFGL